MFSAKCKPCALMNTTITYTNFSRHEKAAYESCTLIYFYVLKKTYMQILNFSPPVHILEISALSCRIY